MGYTAEIRLQRSQCFHENLPTTLFVVSLKFDKLRSFGSANSSEWKWFNKCGSYSRIRVVPCQNYPRVGLAS